MAPVLIEAKVSVTVHMWIYKNGRLGFVVEDADDQCEVAEQIWAQSRELGL